jgi:catalase
VFPAQNFLSPPKILDFKNKKKFKPQQSFETAVSASYDAIAIIAKPKDLLKCNPLKLFTFLQEGFNQCKFIAYTPELAAIFKELKLKPDQGIVTLKNADSCQAFIKICRKLRYWERSKA